VLIKRNLVDPASMDAVVDHHENKVGSWAQRLSAALRDAEERGEYDTGQRYYDHWLTALERLMVEKGITVGNTWQRSERRLTPMIIIVESTSSSVTVTIE